MRLTDDEYKKKCEELDKIVRELDVGWLNCNNFCELLEMNIKFIKGELNATPYHLGPLDNPSQELINNLLKLHKHGIFTVDGQESRCEYGTKCDDYMIDIKQRGYLRFHIDLNNKQLISSFFEQLKTLNIAYSTYNLRTGEQTSNLKGFYWVTQERYYTMENAINGDIDMIPWISCTHILNEHTLDHLLCGANFVNMNNILKNTMYFSFAINDDYGKGNIEEIVLKMCENYFFYNN